MAGLDQRLANTCLLESSWRPQCHHVLRLKREHVDNCPSSRSLYLDDLKGHLCQAHPCHVTLPVMLGTIVLSKDSCTGLVLAGT